MKPRHIALVVEDDRETAEDIVEILRSLDCDSRVVDNVEDALTTLEAQRFCLVLLDLEIKGAPDSIRGHVEHGKSLLRSIRTKHGEHNGNCFALPVLIISGFAREADSAVEVMKDGASDVIQKPLKSGLVSDRIRAALQNSGRHTHDACGELPGRRRLSPDDPVTLAIPGDRVGRRTRVTISGNSVCLTDASLKVFLRLMVGLRKGTVTNKVDFGASPEQGFKGISLLRDELKRVLEDRDIIKNHYHGNYSFVDGVEIGDGDVDKLVQIGDRTIAALSQELWNQPGLASKKSEGNSPKFPTHRRRR